MKNINLSRTQTLSALLIGVMALPALTQNFSVETEPPTAQLVTLYRSVDDEGKMIQVVEDMHNKALEYKDTFRAQRRAYTRAVERCRDRLRDGEDIECPEFNDIATYDIEVHFAAPEIKPSKSTVRDLSVVDRSVLRSYTRAGFCSKAAGVLLYDLCISIIGDKDSESPVGIKSDKHVLRSATRKAGPSTLKLRLQMIDEAISGSKDKRATVRPMGWREDLIK